MKRLLSVGLLVVGVLVFAQTALAAEFRAPKDTESITVNDTDTAKDLHIAGGSVTVNAPISGDLLAAGGTVLITGSVDNSLFASGGTVTIRGKVGHHLRVAGGDITIDSLVQGDVFVAGGTVIIGDQAVINGQLYVSGGQVTVNGTVKGDVRANGGEITINGSVGAVKARVGTLTLGSKAVINGDLSYKAQKQAVIDSNAKVTGTTDFTQVKAMQHFARVVTGGKLLMLLGAMIAMLVLMRFRPTVTRTLVERLPATFAASLGYGFLTLFIAPMALLVLAVTVVGLPLFGLLLVAWILLLIIAGLLAQLFLGSWIIKKLTKAETYPLDWQAVVVGVLATGIIGLVPLIGWVIGFVIFLLALGVTVRSFTSPEVKTI